jgi:hypothetical protein
MEEVSGGAGYPRRDVTWTTVSVEAGAWDPERIEAELVLESLRKFAGLFEDED